jgi:hypothetical protein
MDPNDEQDLKEACGLQDAVVVEQADIKRLEVPNWPKDQVEQMQDTINVVAPTVADPSKMLGRRRQEILDGRWTSPDPAALE